MSTRGNCSGSFPVRRICRLFGGGFLLSENSWAQARPNRETAARLLILRHGDQDQIQDSGMVDTNCLLQNL
jgi:2-phospho-L-lactate transferase/gluconeogenesis factor (CofD/UPF0052 family)